MPIQVLSPPISEPVTLVEAKMHLNLRNGFAAHDDMVAVLIQGAREWSEQYTGRSFASRTVTEHWDYWPTCGIELQRSPVIEVTSVKYIAENTEILETLSPAAYYIDTVSEPARIVYNNDLSLPSLYERPNSVQVTYIAGYSDVANIPAAIKQAILLMVGFWYENREDMPTNETNNPRIRSAQALLNSFKIF